jgi:phospholipid-transporting ATPase
LEREFELIGATAIEDQLQDNVSQTIQRIRRAGVKVWMLTGDKKETAINIGISCGLLETDMAVLEWQDTVEQTLKAKEEYGLRQCCLVASGEDLLRPVEEKLLLELVNSCSAVICCRVTPKQKQDMVWLMRKNKCTTLAIGDGANDVNMINTAHVGIGIKGVEGAQAALCSDYAITEFQMVGELMLYHGRECYRKNSQLILFNFYKNMILVLPQFWYGLYNNFSSATIYDPWVHQLYNVAFTSFPIMLFAIYDQQYSVRRSLA